MARINARHSSDIAKKGSPDEMSGLEPVVFLAKGAHAKLTMNLWTDVGLCIAATGTVLDFIYATNQQPPDMTIAVIVTFDDYRCRQLLKTFQDVCQYASNNIELFTSFRGFLFSYFYQNCHGKH